MIDKSLDKDLSPNRILRNIIENNKKDYTYIILGCPGATGKTWICNGLKQYGFTAFEISEHIYNLVFYKDTKNHLIIDGIHKQVTIILNRPLKTDFKNIIQNRIIEDKSICDIYPPLRPNERMLTIKIPTQCQKCGKSGYYYGETILGTQSTKSDAIIKHIVSDDECMYLCHNCHFDEHKKEATI